MGELYHHGILGMHWGVRRYQNPDGTLTPAGKRRQQSLERESDRITRNDIKRQREWNSENASRLSDEELTNQILRLQREKQLQDLTSQVVTPGRKRVNDFLTRNGELILSTAIAAGVTARINNALKPKTSQKSKYETRKEELDIDTQLAAEGYPISKKGFKFNRKTNSWEKS